MSDWLYTLPFEKDKQNKIIWNAEPNRVLILNQDPVQWEEATKALLDTKGMAASYRPRIEQALNTLPAQELLPFLVDITNEAFLIQDAGAKRLLGTFAEILHAKGLVLLPMARRSQIDWLSTRYTHTKTPSSLEQDILARIPSTVPEKYKQSTLRLLFGFASIQNPTLLTHEDILFFYNSSFYESLSAGYKSAFSHIFQILDNLARDIDPERPKLILSPRLHNKKPTLTDFSAWWFCDPTHGSTELEQWRDAYSQWLMAARHKKIKRHAYASRRLSNYLRQRQNAILSPSDFKRSDAVRTQGSTEPSFAEWLQKEDVAPAIISETITCLKSFFDWWGDHLRPTTLTGWENPYKDRDRKAYGGAETKRSKSNKAVLPKRIIDMAKEVILADDYAFSKTLPMCHLKEGIRQEKNMDNFCPVLPVCLLTLLTLPVRSIQARLLDSGEADANLWYPDGHSIVNKHPLAQRKRELGVLQPSQNNSFNQTSFIGFRISTNKTALQKNGLIETPYDIPWQEPILQNAMTKLREWQMKNNPVRKRITRNDILEKGARIDGNFARLPEYTFLFRDPNGYSPEQPVTWHKLTAYWALILKEVQHRLEQEGTNISLVEEVYYKSRQRTDLVAKYPLHSLRVSGITHFMEAGVPLHVLAEFVAGHSQLLMTLYYTKIDDTKVRTVLDDAVKRMDAIDDEDVLAAIQDMQADEWDTAMVAGPDARQAAQTNDTGMWHIDIDGICPVGRTRCHEGGELLRDNGRKETYAPISFNSFNCALCRFRLTGPAFLQGQVTVFNATLHAIKEKSDQRAKIELELSQVRESGTERKIRTLKDRLDRVDEEIATLVVVLGRRLTHIQMSHALLKRNGEHSFLTGLDNDDLNLILQEASEWEALDFAAQTSSFFPELGTTSARFRKGMLLDRVAQANGLDPLFLSLSPEVAAEAANRLTSLLDDMIGPQKVRDLMEYKTTLEELGLAGGFAQLVDKSIAIAQGNPLLLENKP